MRNASSVFIVGIAYLLPSVLSGCAGSLETSVYGKNVDSRTPQADASALSAVRRTDFPLQNRIPPIHASPMVDVALDPVNSPAIMRPAKQIVTQSPSAVAIPNTPKTIEAPSNRGASSSQGKTSQFIWEPEKSPQGPMVLVVSLADQQAYVYRNGVRIGQTSVSTGRAGYETPTGVFTILQKKKRHISNLYEGAKMPYMQRLTWDGIALHGGHVPDRPASHGCIRLPHKFARLLYKETNFDTKVVIADSHSGPAEIDYL